MVFLVFLIYLKRKIFIRKRNESMSTKKTFNWILWCVCVFFWKNRDFCVWNFNFFFYFLKFLYFHNFFSNLIYPFIIISLFFLVSFYYLNIHIKWFFNFSFYHFLDFFHFFHQNYIYIVFVFSYCCDFIILFIVRFSFLYYFNFFCYYLFVKWSYTKLKWYVF